MSLYRIARWAERNLVTVYFSAGLAVVALCTYVIVGSMTGDKREWDDLLAGNDCVVLSHVVDDAGWMHTGLWKQPKVTTYYCRKIQSIVTRKYSA